MEHPRVSLHTWEAENSGINGIQSYLCCFERSSRQVAIPRKLNHCVPRWRYRLSKHGESLLAKLAPMQDDMSMLSAHSDSQNCELEKELCSAQEPSESGVDVCGSPL